jgi:ABC-type branched-subunit amino acid transport system substrate-binding protein
MNEVIPVPSRRLVVLWAVVAVCLTVLPSGGCSSRSRPVETDRFPGKVASAFDPPHTREQPEDHARPIRSERPIDRGKAIYLTGISPSGRPVRAQLEGGGAQVPAAVLTCGNCHGSDGIGKPEGGIAPATITWEELTKEYGLSHPSGRRRPVYDEPSVRKAITMGLDPAGRALDSSMPRYALAREDLDDLLAYLKVLGRDSDPGITDQAIVVGTILAPASSLGHLHRAVKSVLTAYFQEVNRRGGIYGRRVELRCLEASETAEERALAGRPFLRCREAFALVAPFIAGSDDEITDAAREEKLPVLGPFTLYPKSDNPLNRYVFYLHSGLADQARALAIFAGDHLAPRRPDATVVFLETDPEFRAVAQAVQAECARLGWEHFELIPASSISSSPVFLDRLKRESAQVVFILSRESRNVNDLLNVVSRDWRPLVLMPGALAGKEVMGTGAGLHDRVFLSFPTLPLDNSREGTAEYERLASAYDLPREHRPSQIEALAAAKIFVDAMTATGRSASREKLIEQLEGFYKHPTGLTRPITYGPNRRFGNCGAYIVRIDPKQGKFVSVSDFIEISSP